MLDVVSLSQVCLAIFPMDKNIEQRIYLKFCIANGISCAESLKMLKKDYGKSTLSKTRGYEWYSAFKSGQDVVKDFPRSSRPSTSSTEVSIANVKEMVTENRHLSLREIVAELSMSHESIRTILNDCLGMKDSWILYHDNAPSQKAIIVNKFLTKNSTNIIEQPPYSPDIAPTDFFLFPKLNTERNAWDLSAILI